MLSIIYELIAEDPFALLTEHYVRVKLIKAGCARGWIFEEATTKTGYSTFVSLAADTGWLVTKLMPRSEPHRTKGHNLDVKLSVPEPIGIDLKCRGNFGSNFNSDASLIMKDIDRAVSSAVSDLFILATTREAYAGLIGYHYKRYEGRGRDKKLTGETEIAATIFPPYDQIGFSEFDVFRGRWSSGPTRTVARRCATSFGEERVLLAFSDDYSEEGETSRDIQPGTLTP